MTDGWTQDQMDTCKYALSNMLGSVTYMYGNRMVFENGKIVTLEPSVCLLEYLTGQTMPEALCGMRASTTISSASGTWIWRKRLFHLGLRKLAIMAGFVESRCLGRKSDQEHHLPHGPRLSQMPTHQVSIYCYLIYLTDLKAQIIRTYMQASTSNSSVSWI